MITENDLFKLIKVAAKAPSGHNAQPWKFIPGKSSVTIFPDFERALPVADANNRELYISIGCALENLKIAAKVHGYNFNVQINNNKSATTVEVNFNEGRESAGDQLFNYIETRQVRRNLFFPQKVPESIITELLNVNNEKNIRILPFQSHNERKLLTPLLLEATALQTGRKDFINELIYWTRFSEKEAIKHGDGLWTPALNLPNCGRLLGKLLFSYFITTRSEMQRWKKIISHTPCFMLFTVDKDEPMHWIKLGEVFQRVMLTATKYELSHSHANMPCEESSVREKMKDTFNLQHSTPLLLIRLGYSQPMPYSFRRRLNEVIIK